MTTKFALLISFVFFTVVTSATAESPTLGGNVKRQSLNNFHPFDTTKNPLPLYAAPTDLKTKMLGIWRDAEGENATFEIKPNNIYYFEHGTAYKYSLTGNVLNIKFPDYTFIGKVSIVRETMVIISKEFGASKYKRMK